MGAVCKHKDVFTMVNIHIHRGVSALRKSGHCLPSLPAMAQRLGNGILLGELF